jgi:hypothetical protein
LQNSISRTNPAAECAAACRGPNRSNDRSITQIKLDQTNRGALREQTEVGLYKLIVFRLHIRNRLCNIKQVAAPARMGAMRLRH